jgi:hypothetical protein
MAKVGRITKLTMGAAVAALLGATASATAAGADPGAPWHHRFHPHAVAGTVSAVNGSSAAGTCGTGGSAGAFTVTTKHQSSDTVDVSTTTAFFERGVTTPSFADVCVGDLAGAIGTLAGTTLDAGDVFVTLPPPTPGPTGPAAVPDSVHGPAQVSSVHTDSSVPPHPGTPPPGSGRRNGNGRDPRQGFAGDHGPWGWGSSAPPAWEGATGPHGRR